MRFSRNRKLKLLKIGVFVTTLTIVILYIIAALKPKVTPLYANGVVETAVGDIRFDFSTGVFTFTSDENDVYLKGFISETLRSTSALKCSSKDTNKNKLCLVWLRYSKLEIEKDERNDCHVIKWSSTSRDFSPQDCFTMQSAHWYGGSLLADLKFPLEYSEVPMQPYITNDIFFKTKVENIKTNIYGNVLERFWINSNGVGVIVDSSVPLHVSLNETGSKFLCFKGDFVGSPYLNSNNEPPFLKYTVCKQKDVKSMRDFLQLKHFEKVHGIPDLAVMQKVTWSTKAKLSYESDQNKVIIYSDKINKRFGHESETMNFEIYEPYSSAFGSFNFRTDKFSNAQQMIGILKENKFDVSAILTPFVSIKNGTVNLEKISHLLIQDMLGKAPALTNSFQGPVGIFDFSNPETQKWYRQNLEDMKSGYHVKNFTFNGCETGFIPIPYKTHQEQRNPCLFIVNFVQTIIEYGCQVTCGHKTQKYPVYIHLSSRDSTWDHANGLNSIIPSVLTLGILGYPFVIPDVIGGNGFQGNNITSYTLPDRELYIRWLLLASYMPAMKFSIPPWEFDDEVVELTKTMLKKRKDSILPLILKAARETEHTGAPIVRPIWWLWPTDTIALSIGNQFMIGETLMVAPVLTPGTTEIDIYLPEGDWFDELNNKNCDGGQWLKSYRVELHQIATFRQTRNIGMS